MGHLVDSALKTVVLSSSGRNTYIGLSIVVLNPCISMDPPHEPSCAMSLRYLWNAGSCIGLLVLSGLSPAQKLLYRFSCFLMCVAHMFRISLWLFAFP